MAQDPHSADRVAHILALMKDGDDAFNRRDKAAMDAAHHPEMVAHITGNAEPIHGREAHAAAMDAMFQAFPDVHIENDPYPLQFGQGDWMTVVTKATGTFSGEMALPDGKVSPGPASPLRSISPPRRGGRAMSSSRSTCSGTRR
jgi:SnoaL-like polyketide cyclase